MIVQRIAARRRLSPTEQFLRLCKIRSSSCIQLKTTTAKRNASTSARPHLPPMPRVLAPIPQHPSNRNSAPFSQRMRDCWNSGTILISFGSIGMAVMAFDRYLQYQDRQDASRMVGMVEEETRQKRQELLLRYKDAPALFSCIVREEYSKMGGTHGLKHARVSDVVEVLEENVGPKNDKLYHLCRKKTQDGQVMSIGWFPIRFLEKIDKK